MEELHPEYGLRPAVCYVGLPKRFIAGEVILADQQDECAEEVRVTLIDGAKKTTTRTDNYGDFEFEGLEPNTEYTIMIEYDGYTLKEFLVDTKVDVNLGEIFLLPHE